MTEPTAAEGALQATAAKKSAAVVLTVAAAPTAGYASSSYGVCPDDFRKA